MDLDFPPKGCMNEWMDREIDVSMDRYITLKTTVVITS